MLIPKTIYGGITPREESNGKLSTAGNNIVHAAPPAKVYVPMLQNAGAPNEPVVKLGEYVLMGQIIGDSQAFISAPVHSPVSGKVTAITNCTLPTGGSSCCVVIENDMQDTLSQACKQGLAGEDISAEKIISQIRQKGVVGLGGATFPTAVKLSPPAGKHAESVIINGSECEPYLTSDHRLMLEHSEKIIDGLQLSIKALSAKTGYIAIEKNKPDAIAAMRAAVLRAGADYEIVELPVIYPQGSEKQLIYSVLGKVVPAGGLPVDVGAIVLNVGTACAISRAVRDGMPVMHRVVTVAGDVMQPKNLLCRIGTPVSELIEQCGGFDGDCVRLIMGGPMMGTALHNLDVPVTKCTNGLIAFNSKHKLEEQSACIRCGRCVFNCPMRLQPADISANSLKRRWDACDDYGVMNCIECGCCAYVCPAKRHLVQHIRTAKHELTMKKRKV